MIFFHSCLTVDVDFHPSLESGLIRTSARTLASSTVSIRLAWFSSSRASSWSLLGLCSSSHWSRAKGSSWSLLDLSCALFAVRSLRMSLSLSNLLNCHISHRIHQGLLLLVFFLNHIIYAMLLVCHIFICLASIILIWNSIRILILIIWIRSAALAALSNIGRFLFLGDFNLIYIDRGNLVFFSWDRTLFSTTLRWSYIILILQVIYSSRWFRRDNLLSTLFTLGAGRLLALLLTLMRASLGVSKQIW